MSNFATMIADNLSHLLGLKLSAAYYAGNVRLFHFEATPIQCRLYALHLQCAWRLEKNDTILTGLNDWYIPAIFETDTSEDWDPNEGGSLQETVLRELLNDTGLSSRSIINKTDNLVVIGVKTDLFGGFRLDLSDGVHLSVFPCSSKGEQWRLFQPDTELDHFVVNF